MKMIHCFLSKCWTWITVNLGKDPRRLLFQASENHAVAQRVQKALLREATLGKWAVQLNSGKVLLLSVSPLSAPMWL